MPQALILLHGFASSGNSRKAQFLRLQCAARPDVTFHAFDFNPTPVDFEHMTITGMINRLRQFIVDRQMDDVLLIGSSMGALVALNYAHRFGGVRRMLLLAPALSYFSGSREEADVDPEAVQMVEHYAFGGEIPLRRAIDVDGRFYRHAPPPPAPMVIIHGRFDDVIPIAHSQQYASQYPKDVTLLAVDADHPLNDRLDLMWRQVTDFLLGD